MDSLGLLINAEKPLFTPVPKAIDPIPTMMPITVPIKPKYKGIGICTFISSCRASQFRSTISFTNIKSLTAPLFFTK